MQCRLGPWALKGRASAPRMHAPLRPRSGLGWSGCHPRFGIRLAHSGGCCWRRHVSQTLQIILMQPELLKSPRLSQPFPTAPSLPSCPATTTPFLQVSALISSCGWIFRIPPFLIQHTFYLRSPVPSALFNVRHAFTSIYGMLEILHKGSRKLLHFQELCWLVVRHSHH